MKHKNFPRRQEDLLNICKVIRPQSLIKNILFLHAAFSRVWVSGPGMIFDLALGLSQQVSHSLLACSLQLLFSSDQSHPPQWLTNILLVNPSDAPHVKSHQRKMLIFFTPSCRDSGKILNSQMKNSFSRRSPSRVRPRRKRARLLLIVLLQLPQTIFILPAHVIWNWKSA